MVRLCTAQHEFKAHRKKGESVAHFPLFRLIVNLLRMPAVHRARQYQHRRRGQRLPEERFAVDEEPRVRSE